MSVDVALRLVEERNSSRNWVPAVTAVGLRLQSAGTSVAAGATVEALVTAGTPSEPVVKVRGVVAGDVLEGGGVVAGRGVGVGDDDGLALADGRRNRDHENIRCARPRQDAADRDGTAAGRDREGGGRGQV